MPPTGRAPSEQVPLAALLLHGLQELRDYRQNLAHDLADILRRQGSLSGAEAAAERGHRLILVLLRLSDDLRQNRSDLLQNGADVLLRQLALRRAPAPARGELAAAEGIAGGAVRALANPPLTDSCSLLALGMLEQRLHELL